MSTIDTTSTTIFVRLGNRVIRHVEKHQGISMDYTYWDDTNRCNFDVRDLPDDQIGTVSREAVLQGDRGAHRDAIKAWIKATTPAPAAPTTARRSARP